MNVSSFCLVFILLLNVGLCEDDTPPVHHKHEVQGIVGVPMLKSYEHEFGKPRQLAFNSKGVLFITDWQNGQLVTLSPDGEFEVFADGFNIPAGIAIDKEDNVYVANYADGEDESGSVEKLTPGGKRGTIIDRLTGPKGLCFDKKGRLYISCFADNKIIRLLHDATPELVADNIPTPADLTFDSKGNLYTVSSQPGDIYRISPSGAVSVFARGFNVPSAIATSPEDTIIATNHMGSQLFEVNNKGDVSTYLDAGTGVISMTFDTMGNLYLLNWNKSTLQKVITRFEVGCPHCEKKIPVEIQRKKEKVIKTIGVPL
jgi:sugar lactone lactonase YvrE